MSASRQRALSVLLLSLVLLVPSGLTPALANETTAVDAPAGQAVDEGAVVDDAFIDQDALAEEAPASQESPAESEPIAEPEPASEPEAEPELQDEVLPSAEERWRAAGNPLTPEQLASIVPLGIKEGEEPTGAADLPLLEASTAARALGFTPAKDRIWPLSNGTGFCYGVINEDSNTLEIYRYTISTASSKLVGSVPINKQTSASGSSTYSRGDFECFVANDKLYYVECSTVYHGWDASPRYTVTYNLCQLDLLSGTRTVLFGKDSTVTDGCRALGVDGSGRVYWADYDGKNLYVFSRTGTLLASAAIPVVESISYAPSILDSFVGFDATNGNFYFNGFDNWSYWGYDHTMACLYMGTFDGSNITFNTKRITIQYQTGFYIHYGCAALLGDRYLADLSTFSGGQLAIIDSHAVDINDVTDSETTINPITNGLSVTTVALPAEKVVFGADTHGSTYESSVDVTGVGPRCAYFSADGQLVVDKGSKLAISYDLGSGAAQGQFHTTYDIYRLMSLGSELAVIERDESGTLYLERFSMAKPTKITLSGPTSLTVGGKGDYHASATSDLQPEVTFASSDPTILSIDAKGRAAANKAGRVTITATSAGGLKATRTVTVSGVGVTKTWPDVTALSGQACDNWNDNDYSTYGSVVRSYLANTGKGLMRLAARDGDVLIEYYNEAGKVTSTKSIKHELSSFGGFFAGSDGSFYLAYGEPNTSESDTATVVRVVRYDSAWNRKAACNISGINTYIPFDDGSLRMDEAGDRLYVHTCHEMYDDGDGYHHQANMTFVITESTMKLADSYSDTMNLSTGYVSHSYNQFVRVLDGEIYRVDHGDGYPRGIALTATATSKAVSEPHLYGSLVTFPGGTGYNYTGGSVGGLEVSDTCAVVAYNQDATFGESPRNVCVAAYDRDGESDPVVTKVTSHQEGSTVTCLTPQLVRVNDRHLLLMWAEHDTTGNAYRACFALLDHTGQVVAGPVTKTLPVSDCQPILMSDGSVGWYVSSDAKTTLYTINPYDLDAMSDDNFEGLLLVSLAYAKVDPVADQAYTGKALTPKPKVTLDGRTLVEGTDYRLSYKNNVNVGTATITVTGMGFYTGTRQVTFRIARAQTITASDKSVVAGEKVSLEAKTSGDGKLTYSSGNQKVATVDSNGLVSGKSAGTAKITIIAASTTTYGEARKTVTVTVKAPEKRVWTRLWGRGSLDTAAEIVKEGWSDGVGGTVVVARNDDFKDALAGAGLAGLYDGPIVLTSRNKLAYQAKKQLQRLKPSRVYVAGGPGALKQKVVDDIVAATGLPRRDDWSGEETGVIRLWGNGSPETSAALADAGGGMWRDGTAIIATNKSFKDALSAAPISYAKHWPILLASGGERLSGDVLWTLWELDIERVYIVGGTGAVKPYVEEQLKDWGIKVAGRKWGQTGWQTSREIAKWGLSLGLSADGMGYATSQKFPDALAGAALLGRNSSVLLLADQAAQGNLQFAKDHASEITHGYVFGGTSAFSDSCYGQLPK